jgi:transcriptional regulator with XRE-family HTH domain
MEKSVFTREYTALLRLLKETRIAADLTQTQLAERLGQSQSFVSKCERGERRLDVIQLRMICHILGSTLPEFVAELERRLSHKRS